METQKSEWLRCLICENKTRSRLRRDTVLKKCPFHCPKCKKKLHRNLIAALPECRSCPFFPAAFSHSFPFGNSCRSIPFKRSIRLSVKQEADAQRYQKSAGASLSLQNDEIMYRS
ncbi:MAG: hypothetical protein HFE84_04240 [Lachnospiraceae bacterium]|nr:hypothetical protein [Lachnospiraceae bacterium]